MARYRFLLLNAAGGVHDFICMMFDTKKAAFDFARLSMGSHSAVEVWSETAFLGVAVLALEAASQPPAVSDPLPDVSTS